MALEENAGKRQLKILVIEDDPTLIKLYERVLSNDGHRVFSAKSGGEAVNKLKDESFDVVCLDLKLPDIDGVDLLKVIKRKIEWIPVIIVTANPSLESSVAALNAGIVTEYIMKPFDTKELMIVVRQSVEKAKLVLDNKRLLKRLENTNQALTQRVEQLEEIAQDHVKLQKKFAQLNAYVESLGKKFPDA